MATFGNRPEDVLADSKGNVRPDVVITVFASEADAISNRNSIGSESTGADGRWPIDLSGKTVVWAREPNGSVWSVASDTALSDHETRLDTVETELPNKLEAADISGKADVTYVDTGLAAKIDTATANSTYETGTARIIHVSPSGNDSRNGKTWGTAKATIAAAVTALAGDPGTIMLDFGTHEVGNGLPLSGARCSIVGRGAGSPGVERTAIKASTQTGPVLDFTGYLWPDSFRGRVEFGHFSVLGSGVADATKNNAGMRIATPTQAAGSGYFHDIAVRDTGGPGVDMGIAYLCDFERITVVTPVGAKANDVPYFKIIGANGNRFIGLGMRSMTASDDTGASGALVIDASPSGTPSQNLFLGTWFEFLHLPTGGCLISAAGNANSYVDTEYFDCSKEAGATGTAFMRLLNPTSGAANIGANSVRGYIPGYGLVSTSIDVGIEVRQSYNLIEGIKGYNGSNVVVATGVTGLSVLLHGVEANSTQPAFINNSTGTRNVLIDRFNKTEYRSDYAQDQMSSGAGAAGPRIYDPVTPANGGIWLGQSGARILAVGASAYANADAFTLRDVAQTAGKLIRFDLSFRPGITFPDHGALPAATSGLRGKIVFVQGAAGVADAMYVCRKNAADAYEWAALA